MNIKSWKEHKIDMQNNDSRESTKIFSGCLLLFIVIVTYQFYFTNI
jgi:hypothetical protein